MKIVRIFTLLLALLLVLAVPALADTGGVQIQLEAEETVSQGDVLELSLAISADDPCDCYGYYLELDPAIFTVVDYQIQDTNLIQFSTFDNQGLVVAYGLPAVPQNVICKVRLQIANTAPLGKITLSGNPAAKLGTEELTPTTNAIELEILCGHVYGQWEQTDGENHSRQCTKCQYREAATHSWDPGSVTKNPSCDQEGEILYVCTECYLVKSEKILPQHTYDHPCDPSCNLCGGNRSITHQYAEDWSADADGHYKACTICLAQAERTAHVPNRESATDRQPVICSDCSYILAPALGHTHRYHANFSMDAAGHYYTCSGCMELGLWSAHKFENACDTQCDVCGYVREVTHVPIEGWFSEEQYHYHVCQICNRRLDERIHAPGGKATEQSGQLCLVCNRKLTPALEHQVSEQWFFDEDDHYHQCACGEKLDKAEHIWHKQESGLFTCSVCGMKKTATPVGWWIAGGVVVIGAILGILLYVRAKKKAQKARKRTRSKA